MTFFWHWQKSTEKKETHSTEILSVLFKLIVAVRWNFVDWLSVFVFWCAAVPNALNIAMHKEPSAKTEVKRSAAAKFGWNKKWNSWWQLEYRSSNSAKNCERGRAHSGLDKRQERPQTQRFRTEDAQIFLKKCILFFCTRFWWFFFASRNV